MCISAIDCCFIYEHMYVYAASNKRCVYVHIFDIDRFIIMEMECDLYICLCAYLIYNSLIKYTYLYIVCIFN